MEKRRIGEDFKYVWSINWNGAPEDFSDTLEMILTASVYGKRKELERDVDYVVDGNLLKIDFTPKICTISGIYNLELNYVKPSDGFIDGERRSAGGSTEFLGGVKSPFTDISSATIEDFWQEEITSWANNFYENQYTTSLVIRIIPCRNILNGQVFRIHALRRGITLQPEEYNGFYDNGELLNEIQLSKGDALEMVCICFNGVFHSWDIIRRYKCRPYDL